MSGPGGDLLWQAVQFSVAKSVKKFRLLNGVLVVALGACLVGSLLAADLWGLPRWPAYPLAVLLAGAAFLFRRVNGAYPLAELRSWERLLALAASVEAQARSATPAQAVPGKKSMTPSRPMLRVIHPNDEPPQNGSR